MTTSPATATEQDINDAFDDIVFAEERRIAEAYEQGYTEGSKLENVDAYHLGYHRGAEIGDELGYYDTVITAHANTEIEKAKSLLISIRADIDRFPRTNSEDIDIAQSLDSIRAQFKKACALLKIKANYPRPITLNF